MSPTSVQPVLNDLLGVGCRTSRRPQNFSWELSDGSSRDLVYDPYNHRLKIYRLGPDDLRDENIRFWKAGLNDAEAAYSKLIVYALPGDEPRWVREGFLREAIILSYFADGQDAWIWSAFTPGEREMAPRDGEHEQTVELAAGKPTVQPVLEAGFTCRQARLGDARILSDIMNQVFSDYPTLLDVGTIQEQIRTGSNLYRLAFTREGRLAAAASAEIDPGMRSAELTDCATLPIFRGHGLMAFILAQLERDLIRDLGITSLYTMARADEVGMNCVFSKLGWIYSGRLVNNCRMPNGWESMNIWCAPPVDAE